MLLSVAAEGADVTYCDPDLTITAYDDTREGFLLYANDGNNTEEDWEKVADEETCVRA